MIWTDTWPHIGGKEAYENMLVSYTTGEFQIKTMRYPYTSVRMTKFQKVENTKC